MKASQWWTDEPPSRSARHHRAPGARSVIMEGNKRQPHAAGVRVRTLNLSGGDLLHTVTATSLQVAVLSARVAQRLPQAAADPAAPALVRRRRPMGPSAHVLRVRWPASPSGNSVVRQKVLRSLQAAHACTAAAR